MFLNENENKNLKSEWLVFALKNITSNEFLLILFHYLMSISIIMRTFIKTHY